MDPSFIPLLPIDQLRLASKGAMTEFSERWLEEQQAKNLEQNTASVRQWLRDQNSPKPTDGVRIRTHSGASFTFWSSWQNSCAGRSERKHRDDYPADHDVSYNSAEDDYYSHNDPYAKNDHPQKKLTRLFQTGQRIVAHYGHPAWYHERCQPNNKPESTLMVSCFSPHCNQFTSTNAGEMTVGQPFLESEEGELSHVYLTVIPRNGHNDEEQLWSCAEAGGANTHYTGDRGGQ